MLPAPYYTDEKNGITLYCGDALAILPHLSGIGAIVTDPPYGIGAKFGKVTTGKWPTRNHGVEIEGDSEPFDPSPWLRFRECILWGANYYSDKLPKAGWLVWDKRRGVEGMEWSRSDCELAFCKGQTTVKVFRHLWHGLCRDSEIGEHYHPSQKPAALFEWCLRFVESPHIIDPYAGSGPCAVACLRHGRKYTGMELRESYCEIAKQRLIREAERYALIEPETKPKQLSLLEAP